MNNDNKAGSSYEDALDALLSIGTHQTSKEDRLKRPPRRTHTILDMRYYWNKILKHTQQSSPSSRATRLIHITGTKGKGSTSCLCEAILRANGYSTGLFTSPHLIDIRERIRWNGKPIHRTIFGEVYWKLRKALETPDEIQNNNDDDTPRLLPTYFRMLTLMGLYTFLYHLDTPVDVIILEVGIGGRYDATNFLDSSEFESVAHGVTLLDLDHIGVLGNTLELIAWEKGGIFSVNKLNPEGTSIKPDTQKASKNNISGTTVTPEDSSSNFVLDSNSSGVVEMMRECARIEGQGGTIDMVDASGSNLKDHLQKEGLTLGLAGSHQYGNATLALALCQAVVKRDEARVIEENSTVTLEALAKASWPGRCQKHSWSMPGTDNIFNFYLDGAHTLLSMQATVEWFESASPNDGPSSPILVFACSHERDPIGLLQLLRNSKYSRVYFAKTDSSKPTAVEESSAEELMQSHGITVRNELCGTPSCRTWQQTLSIVWNHLAAQESQSPPVFYNMKAGEILEDLLSLPRLEHPRKVFVTGSLYLVGSFLTALKWEEESSPPLAP